MERKINIGKGVGRVVRKVKDSLTYALLATSIILTPVQFSKFKPTSEKPISIAQLRAEEGKMGREEIIEWYEKYVERSKTLGEFADGVNKFYNFLNSSAFEKVVEDKEAVKAELIKRLERGRVKYIDGHIPLVTYGTGKTGFGASFSLTTKDVSISMNGQGIWIPLEDLQEIYYERTGRELGNIRYMTREQQLELLKIAVEWFFDNYVLDAKIYRHKETGAELGVFFYKDFRESEKKGENVYKVITVHIYGEEAKKLHQGIRGVAYVTTFATKKDITKLKDVSVMADIYTGKYIGTVAVFNVEGEKRPLFVASFSREKTNANKVEESIVANRDTLRKGLSSQWVVLRDYH